MISPVSNRTGDNLGARVFLHKPEGSFQALTKTELGVFLNSDELQDSREKGSCPDFRNVAKSIFKKSFIVPV